MTARSLVACLLTVLITGCATHVTTIRMDATERDYSELNRIGESVAERFGFVSTAKASSRELVVGEGWRVLGDYSKRTSHEQVYLSIFAAPERSEAKIRIFDYNRGHESELIGSIRSNLEKEIRRRFPRRDFKVAHETIRTLPP